MTRRYEMMVILDSSQSEEDIDKMIAKIEESITSTDGGEMIQTDKWGKKRLAYEIKGKQFGFYVVFEFLMDPELINEFDRNLRFDNDVIRHMIIHISPKVVKLKEREKDLKVSLEDRRRRMADEAEEAPVVDMLEEKQESDETAADEKPEDEKPAEEKAADEKVEDEKAEDVKEESEAAESVEETENAEGEEK